MTNTSATGGYLQPLAAGPAPLEDAALDNFLQALVVGITGLDGTLVRQRWQVNPPNQPAIDVDWCAIGVVDRDADINAAVLHQGAADGNDLLVRTEWLDILASFYGPHADTLATVLRDGFYIAQNREAMFTAGFGLTRVHQLQAAPTLTNERWLYRMDVPFRVTRIVEREYGILNLVEADGTIDVQDVGDQLYTETITVTGP